MKLCIYCAGGYGKEVYDIALRINAKESRWDEIVFIDDSPGMGDSAYLGRLFTMNSVLKEINTNTVEVIIANGEPAIRKQIFLKVKSNKLRVTTLVDPSAIISPTARLAEGVIVSPFSSVSSSSVIGANVSINANTIVGHDISIGDHSVVSSFVSLGGTCSIGENCYIAMGVQIKEGISIGSDVIVGMGSVVFHNIPNEVIVLGNPARPLRRNEDKKVFKKI